MASMAARGSSLSIFGRVSCGGASFGARRAIMASMAARGSSSSAPESCGARSEIIASIAARGSSLSSFWRVSIRGAFFSTRLPNAPMSPMASVVLRRCAPSALSSCILKSADVSTPLGVTSPSSAAASGSKGPSASKSVCHIWFGWLGLCPEIDLSLSRTASRQAALAPSASFSNFTEEIAAYKARCSTTSKPVVVNARSTAMCIFAIVFAGARTSHRARDAETRIATAEGTPAASKVEEVHAVVPWTSGGTTDRTALNAAPSQ
mmetsp:Transcript_17225/g.58236  ORF Transcript_17225/g.58236 Transcript_17225/m.58236 type:complete len:264 (+) Transcript_17225:80-871(+)